MSGLNPLDDWRATSVAQEVRERIQTAIMTGFLKPGQPLIQEDLCRQLQVSRQPVRMALKQLEAEGLLSVRGRNSGYMVRVYSEDEIAENYELRKLLEGRAAHAAAQALSPETAAKLQRAIESQEEAVGNADSSGILQWNRVFHETIWDAANRPLHAALIRQLWASVTAFTTMLVPGRAVESCLEHRAILGDLVAGHRAAAAASMRDHITRAQAQYSNDRRRGHAQPDDASASPLSTPR
jgi:DNA-binding GntR family transcriptional regulator